MDRDNPRGARFDALGDILSRLGIGGNAQAVDAFLLDPIGLRIDLAKLVDSRPRSQPGGKPAP